MTLINRRNIALVLVLCFLLSASSLASASAQVDASSEIQSAQTQLANAYQSALVAEQAGANITGLAATLNTASLLLSQAEYDYSVGDFNDAQSLAVQSQVTLNGFAAQANALKTQANQQATESFWLGLVAPVLGALAVVVAGFAVWYILKRRNNTSGANQNGPSTV